MRGELICGDKERRRAVMGYYNDGHPPPPEQIRLSIHPFIHPFHYHQEPNRIESNPLSPLLRNHHLYHRTPRGERERETHTHISPGPEQPKRAGAGINDDDDDDTRSSIIDD